MTLCLSVCLSSCLSNCLSYFRYLSLVPRGYDFLPVSVCLSSCLSICLSYSCYSSLVPRGFNYLSICLSVCLSVKLFYQTTLYLKELSDEVLYFFLVVSNLYNRKYSLGLSVCLILVIHPSSLDDLFVCLSVCLSISLSGYLSVCLCLSVWVFFIIHPSFQD